MRKNVFTVLIGLGVAVASIAWVLQHIDIYKTMHEISVAGPLVWMGLSSIYVLGFFPRGIRWKIMLSKVKHVSVITSFQGVVIGYAANSVLPLRLGEVIRAIWMNHKSGISRLTCLGSIAAERIIDGLSLMIILSVALFVLGANLSPSSVMGKLLISGGGTIIVGIVILFLCVFLSRQFLLIVNRIFGTRVRVMAEKLLHSFTILRSPTLLSTVVLLSLLTWLIEGSMFGIMAWVMGIPNPVSVGYCCLGLVGLGVLLPTAPGHIGLFEASVVLGFQLLGLDESKGAALALIIHVAQIVTVVGMGFAIFTISGVRIASSDVYSDERDL